MSSNKEINTNAIDKLEAKIDALLDDNLEDPFSRVGRLQLKINQLYEGNAPQNSRLGRLQSRMKQLDDGFSMKSNRLSRLQAKMNKLLGDEKEI